MTGVQTCALPIWRIRRAGYYTEFCTHFTINSVLEVSYFYDLQPFNYLQFDRRSSITRVVHAKTWNYLASHLPDHFIRSSKVVKEAIITAINDLVQEFWRTSTDEVNGESIFAMRRLHEILQRCLEVCFFWRLPSTWLIKSRCGQTPNPGTLTPSWTLTTHPESNLRFCLMGIERCLISHYLNPKI